MIKGVPFKDFLKQVYAEARRDDVFNGAAALGFYLTLAIFPAMIALMAVIPYLPIPHLDQAIMELLRQALPQRAADLFQGVVEEVTSERRGGLVSFGLVAALWSASTGMYAVMQQLNIAFNVDERRRFLKARATALGLTFLFGVLVLGAFSLVVTGGFIQDWIGNRFGFSEILLGFFVVFRWVIIVLALLLGLALIYYFAPNREHDFQFISAGNVTSTVLLIVASFGFSIYTSNFGNYSAVYGSIGAVIVLMLWLFITGLLIMVGAEINVVLERKDPDARDSTVKQKPNPVDDDAKPAGRAPGGDPKLSPRAPLR
ncbi:MAG: YihY/virulence factor BrkB family protein [Casimicrobiaceae bacterium]